MEHWLTKVLLFSLSTSAVFAAEPPARKPPSLFPTRISSFLNTLGVNAHITYGKSKSFSAYNDLQVTENALEYLGFHYVRDGDYRTPVEQMQRLAEVAKKSHIQYDFVIGAGGDVDVNTVLDRLHTLQREAPDSVIAVEGPNEVNNLFHAKSWAVRYKGNTVDMCKHEFAPLVALQRDLYDAVRNDASLNKASVYNFSSIAHNLPNAINGCKWDVAADLRSMGDMSAFSDYANMHGYPQREPPANYLKHALTLPNPVNGKPIVYTETGFTTESPATGPYLSVSNTVQAKYELDEIFDLYRFGIARTYIYALLDNAPDSPAKDTEQHFGLFYADGKPKAAATAFHNLTSILADDGEHARDFKPTPLAASWKQSWPAPGSNVDEMHAVFQKSDGTYVMVFWGEPDLWDSVSHTERPSAPKNKVTVSLPRKFATLNVFDPLVGTKSIRQAKERDTIDLDVVDHPIILELR